MTHEQYEIHALRIASTMKLSASPNLWIVLNIQILNRHHCIFQLHPAVPKYILNLRHNYFKLYVIGMMYIKNWSDFNSTSIYKEVSSMQFINMFCISVHLMISNWTEHVVSDFRE
jgi:hypothetical protein